MLYSWGSAALQSPLTQHHGPSVIWRHAGRRVSCSKTCYLTTAEISKGIWFFLFFTLNIWMVIVIASSREKMKWLSNLYAKRVRRVVLLFNIFIVHSFFYLINQNIIYLINPRLVAEAYNNTIILSFGIIIIRMTNNNGKMLTYYKYIPIILVVCLHIYVGPYLYTSI